MPSLLRQERALVLLAVARVTNAVSSQLPAGLTKDLDKAYISAKASLASASTAAGAMAQRAREGAFQQANAATAVARGTVLPAVQPYAQAAARQLEPVTKPAAALAAKHVVPAWKTAEKDFEKATHGTPKLQVAVVAAVALLLAVLVLRAVLSWLLKKPKATLAQRGVRAVQVCLLALLHDGAHVVGLAVSASARLPRAWP